MSSSTSTTEISKHNLVELRGNAEAWARRIPGLNRLERAVLLALASTVKRRIPNGFVCFPSLPALARLSCYHRSSVVRGINALEAKGRVKRAARGTPNGETTTYELLVVQLHAAPSRNLQLVAPCDPNQEDFSLTIENSHTTRTPPSSPPATAVIGSVPRHSDDADFRTFMNAYPRKANEPGARQAWSKTRAIRPPLFELLRAIDSQGRSAQWRRNEGQYIPHPGNWLGREGWKDVLPPEPGATPGRKRWSREYEPYERDEFGRAMNAENLTEDSREKH